jgi:hypothetical protein
MASFQIYCYKSKFLSQCPSDNIESNKKSSMQTYFNLHKKKQPKPITLRHKNHYDQKLKNVNKSKIINSLLNNNNNIKNANNNKTLFSIETNLINNHRCRNRNLTQLKSSNSVILPNINNSIIKNNNINHNDSNFQIHPLSITPHKSNQHISFKDKMQLNHKLSVMNVQTNTKNKNAFANSIDNAVIFQDNNFVINNSEFMLYYLNNLSIHLDIEIIFQYIQQCELSFVSTLPYEIENKLKKCLFNYYSNFRLYLKSLPKIKKQTLFYLAQLNHILLKIFKVQLIIFSTLLITLTQYNNVKATLIIKSNYIKLISQLSFALFNIYYYFNEKQTILTKAKDIQFDYKEFQTKFNNVYYKYNYNNGREISFGEIFISIEKTVNNSIQLLKHYSQMNLKINQLQPLENIISQLILQTSVNTNINFYASIILDTLLYSILNSFHKETNIIHNNITINNNKHIPYLPPLNVSKYKYTLVLDMDETLIHNCQIEMNQMHFIRPFCFEFLSTLHQHYEIIIFTSATKEVNYLYIYIHTIVCRYNIRFIRKQK